MCVVSSVGIREISSHEIDQGVQFAKYGPLENNPLYSNSVVSELTSAKVFDRDEMRMSLVSPQ